MLNLNPPDEPSFVYCFLNLSDLFLKCSSGLLNVAHGFEFRIAYHFARRGLDSAFYLMSRTLKFIFSSCIHCFSLVTIDRYGPVFLL